MHLGQGKAWRSWLAAGPMLAVFLVASPAAAAPDATATFVSCTPNPVLVGAATSCSGTVLDTAPGGSTIPQGSLDFSSDTMGAFTDPESGNPATSCTLVHAGENGASCRLRYVPGIPGSGIHRITASYAGSVDHDPSSGFFDLGVSAPTTPGTPPSTGGSPTTVGKKKCKEKKKKKHSAAAAKKKCKKKKRG